MRYYYSTSNVNTGSSYTTSNNVTGKTTKTQYYIWGVAVGNGETILSNNYYKIKTSHSSHTGSESSGGGCYTTVKETCTGGSYYYVANGSPDGWASISRTDRYCFVCGSTAKYNATRGGSHNITNANTKVICTKCGASISVSCGSGWWLYACSTHAKTWSSDAFVKTINGYSFNLSDYRYFTEYKSVRNKILH